MQRKRSAISSLHDSSFPHSSASSDSSIDPERCWNSMRNSSEEQLPDREMPSRSPSMGYMNTANQEGHDLNGWSLAESSLNDEDAYSNQNDPMSVCTGTSLVSGDMQYESSNNLSLDNVTGSLHTDHPASGRLFMQSAFVPQDHITNLEFSGNDENDNADCEITECPTAFGSDPSSEHLHGTNRSFEHFITASGTGGYIVEDTDVKPGSSIDGRPSSWKGKTLEASAGQSSGSGSSNFVPDVESGLGHARRFPHHAASGIPTPVGNNRSVNFSEQSHHGLGLNIGGAASVVPLSISASAGIESSRRNFRLRISAHQQDSIPGIASSSENVGRSSNVLSAHRSLRLAPISNSLDLGSFTVADDGSLQRPTTTFVRNSQSRWYRASSSGAGNLNTAISGERFAVPDEEPTFRSVSREMSEHPIFVPVTEIGTSSQNSINWSLAAGNVGVSGTSASRGSSGSVVNSSRSSLVPHRTSPQYPRRLSEFVRRSLISSPGTEQSSSYNQTYSSPSSSSPEQIHFSGSANQGHHRSQSRSAVMLDRHLGRSLGVPYPSRSLAAGSEGRSRLVSEIRSVLNLMRRGEGLRVEDVMILDQSVFFGMADLHDRHRNMRLDVDNMSYEELLALEERIGDVSTGLSEELISSKLQKRKYVSLNTKDQVEEEPCCICREEYNDGEDLGILECGHDFHSCCIMQWLTQKNLCPICKTTGLNN